MKFVLFVLRYEQQQISSSACNYGAAAAAAVVQTSTTSPGISSVTWVRHWIVHFEEGPSAFVNCSWTGSEINFSI
jgi:hypothetical protein